MIWQELAKIALLGTEHSAFSPQTLEALQAQGIATDKEAPLVLAEAAALHAQLRKAGFPLEVFTGELPATVAPSGEDACSQKSSHHLRLILGGRYGEVLPAFFHHLIKNKKCFPPEHLPALLKRPDLHRWIGPLEQTLSEGGRWFLSQHPAWRHFIVKPTADWHTGNREERLSLLGFLRRNDPAGGLSFLTATWEQEHYSDKKAFLDLMQQGLSIADEPFLEQCLDDGRKEVRSAAARLLALLPESRLCQRMYRRATACLHRKGNSITMTIPDGIGPEDERDGILRTDKSWAGGAKAGYLGQVFSLVPPGKWEAFFKKTPAEIVKDFAKTDWSDTLLIALAKAAAMYGDQVWAGALLGHFFKKWDSPLWNNTDIRMLTKKIAPAAVHALAMQALQERPGLPEEGSPVHILLLNSEAGWPNDLTLLLVRRLQEWLPKSRLQPWQMNPYILLMKTLALRCDPSLYDALQKGWPNTTPLWAFWEKSVEEMLDTVLFRREMIAALADEPAVGG